jgi:hypothetical protein
MVDRGARIGESRWRGIGRTIGLAVLVASVAGVSCWSSGDRASSSETLGVRQSSLTVPLVAVKASWLQYGGDSTHAGSNPFESTLGVNNVAALHSLWTKTLFPPADSGGHDNSNKFPSTPVVDGPNNTLYLVTGGRLVALDASTGDCKWAVGPGTGSMNCVTSNTNGFTATGNSPGATGRALNATPAIDPSLGYVYVAAEDSSTRPIAGFVHKFTSAGVEVTVQNTWPAPFNKKIYPANDAGEPATTSLSIGYAGISGPYYLYVGSGDCDSKGSSIDCEGKVTVINLGTGGQKVWNAICSDKTTHFGSSQIPNDDPCNVAYGAGVWSKAGVTFDPATQRMFMGTSEGADPAPASHIWAKSTVALNADGSGFANGDPVDSYITHGVADPVGGATGTGFSHMGHGHMLVLPNNGSKYPHLGVMMGKEGSNNASLHLINLDNMGGGRAGTTGKEVAYLGINPTTPSLTTEPTATWVNPQDASTWLYYSIRKQTPFTNYGLWAFRISNDPSGNPSINLMWKDPPANASVASGGPFVANGVAYYSDGTNLKALNAVTGQLLAVIPGGIQRAPVVVNGVLYALSGALGTTLTAYTVTQTSNPTNLAFQKWANTSSIAPGSGIPDTVTNGKRATDGNLNGDYSANSVFITDKETETQVAGMTGGPYWYVDLGATYNVNQVVIYNRTDSCGAQFGNCANRLNKFWIHYWTGNAWLLGSDQSNTPIGSPAHRSNTLNGNSNNIISVPVSFTTRYVMIQKANVDYLNLAEVQIFGDNTPQIATASSRSPVAVDSYSPSNPCPGSFSHFMVDPAPLGSHKILEGFNHYNSGFEGWTMSDKTSFVDTTSRGSLFERGPNGSSMDMVGTDSGGAIWEYQVCALDRHKVNGTPTIPAAGGPSGYRRHDGVSTVVFRGTDNLIYQSTWDGSSTWNTAVIPGQTGVTASGDPVGYVRTPASSEVVYKCNSTKLCQLRWINGGWSLRIMTPGGTMKGTTMPAPMSHYGDVWIFYTGLDGLHAIHDPTEAPWGGFTDTLVRADSTIVSSPAAYQGADQNGAPNAVYVTDGGGNNPSTLVEAWFAASQWWTAVRAAPPKTTETLVGDPAAYVAVAPWLNTILFRNSAGKLYQTQWSNASNSYVTTTIPIN